MPRQPWHDGSERDRSLITPGFGGHVYFPTGKGFLTMQVMPKPSPPSGK